MKENNIAICIAGWHFNEEFYDQISRLPQAEVFVVSHKAPNLVPFYVFEFVKSGQIFFEPNFGYDWGCYQQFLSKGIWEKFDYLFFLHDDLVILDSGFIYKAIELLNNGKKIVGNGRNSQKTDWPITHYECYAHSQWKPPNKYFRHETVRGSFLAAKAQTVKRMGNFEIFWDRLHLNFRFGNWSLISTCGKIHAIFGDTSFGFLGDTYLNSQYLLEKERGGLLPSNNISPLIEPSRQLISSVFIKFCKAYMYAYLTIDSKYLRSFLSVLVWPFIAIISGPGMMQRVLKHQIPKTTHPRV